MSEVSPFARDLFPEPLLQERAPRTSGMTEPTRREDLPGMGDSELAECLEGSNQVAMRLACIGDEMDLCLRSPRLAQLPGIAMQSLAVTYSQTGLRGVLRRFIRGLSDPRGNIRFWRSLTLGTWVSADGTCRQLLPRVLLGVVLLGGALHLLLP